jgi:cytochrome c-type biogenesis protein
VGDVSVLLAFGYGVLSFVSPCTLPLIPVYLANIAGPATANAGTVRGRTFVHSTFFVAGFTIVFTLWGAGAGLLGSALATHLALLRSVAGGLLVLFGLLMLASLRVPWLNYERRLRAGAGGRARWIRSFIMGAVFPVAWTPCASWVLGSILLLAGTSQSATRGALLLAVYSLGLGLPFLAAGVALDFLAPFLKRLARYSTAVYVASGLLLIAVGVLFITNRVSWFLGVI